MLTKQKKKTKRNIFSISNANYGPWMQCNSLIQFPPPQVSGLVQASTIMDLHSSLSSASWINLLLGIRFLVAKAFRLLIYVVLCLPLLLFPSIFPQSTVFSSPFFLLMWPTNFSCLFLIVVISERFVSASCNTYSV